MKLKKYLRLNINFKYYLFLPFLLDNKDIISFKSEEILNKSIYFLFMDDIGVNSLFFVQG